MEEDAWVELDRGFQEPLWADFVEEFGFRPGIGPEDYPAIREPTPSVTWDLRPLYERFGGHSRPLAQVVCDVLRECTEYWESVVAHDWVHPSVLYRPHRVLDVTDLEHWDVELIPNGDYVIFVAKDLSFGVFGHPWEQSLCFFGEPAVRAVERVNSGLLTRVLRRDGRPEAS
ncbi:MULTISPECIES: DUF2716 domain-containing protein [Saccharothrix]|uniref:DUF2716 domain-containing protein n=1 Tax=Saccharothrix TaxID=2071 RepID=UPI00093BA07E|nr:DUF2716 domain-containing protein [Saccharothrix sp. CB00851]OKI30450.1 hypothetical protein A6A25_28335 [Saccharothrix sp. CB00851]